LETIPPPPPVPAEGGAFTAGPRGFVLPEEVYLWDRIASASIAVRGKRHRCHNEEPRRGQRGRGSSWYRRVSFSERLARPSNARRAPCQVLEWPSNLRDHGTQTRDRATRLHSSRIQGRESEMQELECGSAVCHRPHQAHLSHARVLERPSHLHKRGDFEDRSRDRGRERGSETPASASGVLACRARGLHTGRRVSQSGEEALGGASEYLLSAIVEPDTAMNRGFTAAAVLRAVAAPLFSGTIDARSLRDTDRCELPVHSSRFSEAFARHEIVAWRKQVACRLCAVALFADQCASNVDCARSSAYRTRDCG
jgi:hypothetical protein